MPETQQFDRPVYSGELFQPQKPSPIEQLKPHYGKIATAIVLIIIVYFVYWFFIGSYTTVKINIKGIDNVPISDIVGSISQDGKTIASINTENKTLNLKQGSYEINIESPGFKPAFKTIDVSSDSKTFTIELEEDIEVQPTSLKLEVNDSDNKIFAGNAENEAILFLSNNSSSTLEVEVLANSDSKEIIVSIIPSTIIVGAKSQDNTARVTIKVSPTLKIADRINGDEHVLTFRVKGTKNEFKRTVRVLPKLQITISPTKLNFGNIPANETPIAKEITLQNNERSEISGKVNFEVKIIQSKENPETEIKKWFSFSPEILSVKSGPTKEQVYVTIPKTAKSETITGEITASTSYWNNTITFTMKVIAAKTTISKPTLSRTNINLTKGDLSKTATLSIKNDSDFTLTNAKIDLTSDCKDIYIIPETTSLPNIPVGSTNTVLLKLKVPENATIGDPKNCNVCVEYDDPLNPGEKINTKQTTDCPSILITPIE